MKQKSPAEATPSDSETERGFPPEAEEMLAAMMRPGSAEELFSMAPPSAERIREMEERVAALVREYRARRAGNR